MARPIAGVRPAPVRNGLDGESVAALDSFVTAQCASDAFSGAIAIAKEGTVVYERACGLASRAFNVPNRIDTKFNLGSMNKMFTAVAIAQLVEHGKLAYSELLAKAWPDYPNRAIAERVTIEQLLSHTSGLGNYWTDEFSRTSKDRFRTINDFLPLFQDKPLEFEPGSRYLYSNSGFMVLGGVIAHVSGEDYFDYVSEHVYAPAGMVNTDAFEMDHDTRNLAIGYTREGEGGAPHAKLKNNLYLHVVKGGPAGGGFSTVRDLLAFGSALLRGTLISPEQLANLTTPRKWGFPEEDYGLGFGVRRFAGQRYFGHSGGFFGINSDLWVFPDSGLIIAAMANLDPPAADKIVDRAMQLFVHAP